MEKNYTTELFYVQKKTLGLYFSSWHVVVVVAAAVSSRKQCKNSRRKGAHLNCSRHTHTLRENTHKTKHKRTSPSSFCLHLFASVTKIILNTHTRIYEHMHFQYACMRILPFWRYVVHITTHTLWCVPWWTNNKDDNSQHQHHSPHTYTLRLLTSLRVETEKDVEIYKKKLSHTKDKNYKNEKLKLKLKLKENQHRSKFMFVVVNVPHVDGTVGELNIVFFNKKYKEFCINCSCIGKITIYNIYCSFR